jgi:hypothetical protein
MVEGIHRHLVDQLILELQRLIEPDQEPQRRLGLVVVEAGVVPLVFLAGRVDAVGVPLALLRRELDRRAPSAGTKLSTA